MYIDIAVLLIILVMTIWGLKKGLIMELFSLFGVFISVICTKYITPFMSDTLSLNINDKRITYMVIYVISFLIVFIGLFMLSLLLKKIVKALYLGKLDKSGGAIIGFTKGILISCIIVILVIVASKFEKESAKQLKESRTVEIALKASPSILKFFPKEVRERVEKYKNNKNIEKEIKKLMEKKDEIIENISDKVNEINK